MNKKGIYNAEKIRDILLGEYVQLYQEKPSRFGDDTHIYHDLHANDPDSTYALIWRINVMRELGVHENALPKPRHGYDYTIGELVNIIQEALRNEYG